MNLRGLSQEEVLTNQKKYGKNTYKEAKRPNPFWLFIAEFNDWLVIILIIAAILSLIVDHENLIESSIIMGILFLNATIGVIQEMKAFKTLDSLKKYNQHQVYVLRDNEKKLIDAKEITINDIIYLQKGDEIPADIRLKEVFNLSCDESILTGESIEISKNTNDLVYASTFVLSGNAIGEVVAVGMQTEMGKIASSLVSKDDKKTPLEIKLAQIGKVIGLIAIIICIGVFFLELALNIPILDAFKSAVSLAVAAIPEGLATVVTICLALGVGKMAKQNVIIKRLEAVETLGCSTVVCSDKTGTLTMNKQSLAKHYGNSLLTKYAAISANYQHEEKLIDPIDKAINDEYQNKYPYEVIQINPFDSNRKYMDLIIKEGKKTIHIYKGAYDILTEKVGLISSQEYMINNLKLMQEGYRVIAIGLDYQIIGLLAFYDPPRPQIEETIEIAKSAHVKTVMITGDHKETAFKIASQIGITKDKNSVISKEELDEINDEDLVKEVEKYDVYARVSPIDKVRIVNAWQKKGAIVAMTGDGVNDAPALKKADIGASMGSGCDLSKDSSDMIIVDNNYKTIIDAIRNGRGIYANIQKCTKYLLASNIGEVLSIVVVTILSLITGINYGIPLASLQLLWINIITDSLPAFGLGVEEADISLMYEKPREKNSNFFANGMGLEIIFIGICIGALTLISYFIGLKYFPAKASTMAFVTISTTQLLHAYNCRNNRSIFTKKIFKNRLLNSSLIIGLVLMLVVIYSNGINDVFSLEKLTYFELLIAIGIAFLIIIISEIRKKIINRPK